MTIPNGVTVIGDHAFYYCDSLTSVTIPNSVTVISNYAFYACTNLASITIPNSVTNIGDNSFLGIRKLFYKGNASEWTMIDGGVNLTVSTVYYYSESEPTESGNWWHYDENDNAVIWDDSNSDPEEKPEDILPPQLII